MTYAPIQGKCPVCHQDSANTSFQAGAASRDAEVVSLTNQRDYEYVRAENAEHDRLLVKIAAKDTEIAELVAALELLSKYIAYNGDDWVQRTALEALAKVRKP